MSRTVTSSASDEHNLSVVWSDARHFNWRWTGSSLAPEYENPLAKKDGMHTVEVKGAVPVPSALVLALLPRYCAHSERKLSQRSNKWRSARASTERMPSLKIIQECLVIIVGRAIGVRDVESPPLLATAGAAARGKVSRVAAASLCVRKSNTRVTERRRAKSATLCALSMSARVVGSLIDNLRRLPNGHPRFSSSPNADGCTHRRVSCVHCKRCRSSALACRLILRSPGNAGSCSTHPWSPKEAILRRAVQRESHSSDTGRLTRIAREVSALKGKIEAGNSPDLIKVQDKGE